MCLWEPEKKYYWLIDWLVVKVNEYFWFGLSDLYLLFWVLISLLDFYFFLFSPAN